MRVVRVVGWVLVVGAVVATACSGGDSVTSVGGAGGSPYPGSGASGAQDMSRICAPGSTQECWGPGRCAGAQVCELHGLSWGPCDCGDGSSGSGVAGSNSAGAADEAGRAEPAGGMAGGGGVETGRGATAGGAAGADAGAGGASEAAGGGATATDAGGAAG